MNIYSTFKLVDL